MGVGVGADESFGSVGVGMSADERFGSVSVGEGSAFVGREELSICDDGCGSAAEPITVSTTFDSCAAFAAESISVVGVAAAVDGCSAAVVCCAAALSGVLCCATTPAIMNTVS